MKSEKGYYENQWDSKAYPAHLIKYNNDTPIHYHSSVELIYVKEGELISIINGRSVPVKKGRLIAVPGYTIHGFQTKSYAETSVLIIPNHYIKHFGKTFENNTFYEYIFEGRWVKEIAVCMHKLQTVHNSTRLYRSYIDLILSILTEKVVSLRNIENKTDFKLVQGVLEYLEEHYAQNLSAAEVSKIFGYSVSSFSRIFNKHIGYSFPTYVGILRVRNAAYLMAEENHNILDAAFASGFENIRTFYRIFKQYFGQTPKEYIKGRKKVDAAES